VQPVLEDFDPGQEEAAATLGATRWQTFYRVILPALLPATITGATLAFARALGEYGSVLLFAGGKPDTQVASIFIGQQIETGNEVGASAVSIVLLGMALICLLIITLIQRWGSRHERAQGAGAGGLTNMPMSGFGLAGSAEDPESSDVEDDQRG
jgi:sulfate/thiosulfate transport system permease protein